MALTMVGPADAAGAVLLLLLRLRLPLLFKCSVLLDVLSNLSVSGAAGDGLEEKKSLVSRDRGVNVCSAKVT
jgi:hypothetical protein